jgi:hypothetical protein
LKVSQTTYHTIYLAVGGVVDQALEQATHGELETFVYSHVYEIVTGAVMDPRYWAEQLAITGYNGNPRSTPSWCATWMRQFNA